MSAVSPAAPSSQAAALYERHGGRVLRFCQSRLGSREDAEDATQTTFLNAVGALRRGTVPRAEAAWLLRIAENVCHHRHRTAARRAESACDPTVLEDVVEAPPGRPDELIHLSAALESLPERQRLAVLLREWQGLSYDEIGGELGLSHSAVETLLFRARRGLAHALEHDGRRRHGLGLGPILGWLKTAVGAGTGLKVATAAVVAGVAVVPIRGAVAPAPATPSATRAASSAQAVPAVAPAQPRSGTRSTRATAPPKRTATAARPETSSFRGGRLPAADADRQPTPSPEPKAADPVPPTDPPARQPGQGTPPPPAPLPAPAPRLEPPPLPLPTVTVPSVTEVPDAVPDGLPGLPDPPAPELPPPGLP